MNETQKEIFENLLGKYRSNTISEQEYLQFLQLLDPHGSEMDEMIGDQARKDWQGSMELLHEIRKSQTDPDRPYRIWKWVSKVAAALVLLCAVWVFWPESIPQDLVYSTNFGETRNIELPDGSLVLLNANSEIVWKGDWIKLGHRSVTLTGEAFFEVVKTDEMHFEVATPGLTVDVLGTEFNVRTRGSETNVYLQEGKVLLEVNSPEKQKLAMSPGDFVQYDHLENNLRTTNQNDLQDKASWVDGMLDFNNKSVPEILGEFENLYGKTFRVENKDLIDKRMDISLPYADWNLVRKALEIALDVEFTTSRDTIIVQ